MSESTVTISLNTLLCNRESQSGGSNPYLWPAMVFIDKTTANVGEIGIDESNAHNVLQHGMKAGDSLTIETTVGQITRFFEDPLTNFAIILTVGLFHADSTPDDSVKAGYRAFQSALLDGVKSNLGSLISTDPSVVDQAKKEISDAVTAAVTSAISDSLSLWQKAEIGVGALTLDSSIGSDSTSFSEAVDSNFTLTIGDPLGGRLLYYRDFTQNGTGDVDTPQVIGQGGWQQFKFLFGGGNNVIYAVDQDGRLLRYVDASQTGGGDVSSPQVVGQGGWQQFQFLFTGWNDIIYAVDQQGQLLFYRDASQTGGGDVSSPGTIGLGGWQQFGFLFGGGNGVIYAAEKDLNPANNYVISGTLTTAPVLCLDQKNAVNQATQTLNGAKSILQELEAELARATANERAELRLEIKDAQQEVDAAQAALDAANSALQACLASSVQPLPTRPIPIEPIRRR